MLLALTTTGEPIHLGEYWGETACKRASYWLVENGFEGKATCTPRYIK